MTDNDTNPDAVVADARPRRTRQPKAARKITFSRIQDGKAIPFGSFPEAVIGEPLERRLLPFIEERNFGSGQWKVDVRNAKGHFEQSYDFSIADTEPGRERIIDIEPEDEADETDFETQSYDVTGEVELRAELIALRREMKDLRQSERERQEAAKGSQSEMLSMMRESADRSEKSFQQGLQMAQMIMQSSQPKENPTELMLTMLKGTLEMQRGVRQLSEEIGPQETPSGGSFMGDAARLIDSVGKNAGTFMPIVLGALGGNKTPPMPVTRLADPMNSNGSSDLANLAEKIQKRNSEKNEKDGAIEK